MNNNTKVYFVRVGTKEIPNAIAQIIKNNNGVNKNQIKTVPIPGDVLTTTNVFVNLVNTQSVNGGVTYTIKNELTNQIIEEARKTGKTFVILYNNGRGWKTTTYQNGTRTNATSRNANNTNTTNHTTRKRTLACGRS